MDDDELQYDDEPGPNFGRLLTTPSWDKEQTWNDEEASFMTRSPDLQIDNLIIKDIFASFPEKSTEDITDVDNVVASVILKHTQWISDQRSTSNILIRVVDKILSKNDDTYLDDALRLDGNWMVNDEWKLIGNKSPLEIAVVEILKKWIQFAQIHS